MLPAYREQALDRTDTLMVEQHLASCKDCCSELSLLRLMADEPVPDPGEAFWASMPGRVRRAVQEQRSAKRPFSLMPRWELLTLPCWSLTAAALAIVLVLSWLVVRPVQNERVLLVSDENGATYEYPVGDDAVVVADLGKNELDAVSEWAGSEMASIALEAGLAPVQDQDDDLYAELSEMDARETARLSLMIEQYKQEV